MPDPIDYAALADQARQSAPPPVDYSALADQARASTPAPNQPGFFGTQNPIDRGLGGIADTVKGIFHNPLTDTIDEAKKAYGSAKRGDYLGAAAHAVSATPVFGPMIRDTATGMLDQGKQAVNDFQQGNYSGAAGHTLAAAIPGIGPSAAQAAETMGGSAPKFDAQGNITDPGKEPDIARGVGQALPMVAPLADEATGGYGAKAIGKVAGKVAPMVQPALDATADRLRASAEKQYGQVLNPTTKGNKLRTAQVVPELIDRGVTAFTQKGLQGQAQAGIAQAGQALEDAYANLPGDASISLNDVTRKIQNQAGDALQIRDNQGQPIAMSPNANTGLNTAGALIDVLKSVAETDPATGEARVPVEKARQLRQYYDEISRQAGRFDGKTLAEQSAASAHSYAADAIRNQLAAEFPDVAAINKEYSFWKNVDQVVGDTILRRQGQAKPLGRKMAKAAGQGAGFVGGGLHGAVLGGVAMDAVEAATTSPIWNTVAAVLKDRLADAIASGSTPQVLAAASRIQKPPQQLLGPGAIQMQPTVDGSYVHSVPAVPAADNGMRALPPASTILQGAGPDTSYVRGIPAQYPEKVPQQAEIPAPAAAQPDRIPSGVVANGNALSPNPGENGISPQVQGPASPVRPTANVPRGNSGVSGAETTVLVPGESTGRPAIYKLRELSDLTPSHSGITFQANPDYPFQNDRNYADPVNQERVIKDSAPRNPQGGFEPAYLINDNPDATNGPPVVTPEGHTLGGNSRVMKLQRAYAQNPQGIAEYRQLLVKKAAQFGIDPAHVGQMKQPVLVREDQAPPENVQRQITDLNKTGTAALTPAEQSTADARGMSPEMAQYIGSAIEEHGPDATLVDALSGNRGPGIIQHLVDSGVFTAQEKPRLVDGKTGAVTQLAKSRISQMLTGQMFRDSEQMQRTPPAIRGKIDRIAAPLLQVQGKAGWNLIPSVRSAVDLIEYANAHGIRNLGDLARQESMFGGGPKIDPQTISIAQALRDKSPNDLAKAFRKYVSDSTPTMFGEFTPQEAFAEHFGQQPAVPSMNGAPPVPDPLGIRK